ncbi:MAG: hypothetical protein U5K00_14520 [Melioribacteraceae bacterium]|nr:hypothetical protein [Melioribacteraceae bacterium]
MIIAVPKEILSGENRVSITPDAASKLIKKEFPSTCSKKAPVLLPVTPMINMRKQGKTL